MHTRRYPRTLQEAFGPYTTRRIEPMRETKLCFFASIADGIKALFQRKRKVQ